MHKRKNHRNRKTLGTLPLLTPPLSTVGWLQKPKKVEKQKNHWNEKEKEKKVVSLHANISNMPFDQRSARPPEECVLNCHKQTDRQTDGHRDSMTESADSVGRFSENH